MTVVTGAMTADLQPDGAGLMTLVYDPGSPVTVHNVSNADMVPDGSGGVQITYTASGGGGGGSGDGMVVTNFNRSTHLANFAAAAATVVGTTAGSRCKVACIGDSTTLGVTSTATVTAGNCYPDALAANLASILGVPATIASWFGDQIILPDTALSGGGATWNFGLTGPGSGMIQIANLTDTATWTPSDTRLHGTFDRVDVYFYDAGAGTGPFDVTVGGNTYLVAAGGGTGNVVMSTITLSSPVTNPSSVVMKLHSGSYCFIAGMAFWSHATPSIEVYNMGIGGTTWVTVNQSVTTGVSVCAAVDAMRPDLVILNYGINDINLGAALATTEGYATTGLTTLSGISGLDLLVVLPNPFTPSGSATFTQAQLQSGLLGVVTTSPLDVPLASLFLTYGDNQSSFTSNTTVMASDPHPSVVFYQDEGARLASLLTDVSGAPYASFSLPAEVTPGGWTLD